MSLDAEGDAAIRAYVADARAFLNAQPTTKRLTREMKNGLELRVSRRKVQVRGAHRAGWKDITAGFVEEPTA